MPVKKTEVGTVRKMISSNRRGFGSFIRYIAIVLIMNLLAVFTSGCWNYREIEYLAAVYAFGLDKDPKSKEYVLTVEINRFESSGKDSTLKSRVLTAEGSSIMEAVANLSETSDKQIYWSQAKVGVIGRGVAEEGLMPLIDTMLRDQETRIDMYLIASKEKTAKEIIKLSEENSSEMLGVRLSELIEGQMFASKAPAIHVYELADMLANPYQSAILGTVGITDVGGEKLPEISGAALFEKGRLKGFLNGEEAQYLLFAMNEFNQSHLALDGVDDDPDVKASIQIDKSKTSITPAYKDGKISMDIYIYADGGIEELYNPNSIDDKTIEGKIKERCEAMIAEKTMTVIQKVQSQYGMDVFGFSNTFKRRKPSLWKEIDDRWQEEFSKMDISVHAYLHITNTGEVKILSEEEI